jgi:hypothetical protein
MRMKPRRFFGILFIALAWSGRDGVRASEVSSRQIVKVMQRREERATEQRWNIAQTLSAIWDAFLGVSPVEKSQVDAAGMRSEANNK